MADFGNTLLLFLLPLSVFTALAGFLAGYTRKRGLYLAARRGVYAALGIVTLSVGALLYLLITGDFSIAYVVENTNRALPLFYKYVALWGGHNGSLLLWTWMILIFAASAVYLNRDKLSDLMPYVIFTIMVTVIFFSILNIFISNPFETLYRKIGNTYEIFHRSDGQGLNPLLQHPAMVIHPPMLYAGYVGMVIPYAFAVAALIYGRIDRGWVKVLRRWTLVAWGFLTAGILLGAEWAYDVLGWGGYWAWDPVENASFLPWLTGTAFLHTIIVQENKGMLKVWNVTLILATYLLAIFGTFLTRSGVVSSVHAFSNTGIGPAFTIFLLIGLVTGVALIVWRRDLLQTEQSLESMLSRESGFLFNNLLFLLATLAVLWGTMFPTISEAFLGEQITIGPPWFNHIMVPLGLAILLLTGLGPLLAWGHTSTGSLKRNFLKPLIGSVILALVLLALGLRNGWALGSFSIAFFVLWTIVAEFIKGTVVRSRNTGENLALAFVHLVRKNPRRYGGYIVHFGVVLLFVGFTGKVFDKDIKGAAAVGDTLSIKPYQIVVKNIRHEHNNNYSADIVDADILKNGKYLTTLHPEKRLYFASNQTISEVDILTGFKEDVYLVLSGMSTDGTQVGLQVYLNHLVRWIWIGSVIIILGTLIALVPAYREATAAAAKGGGA